MQIHKNITKDINRPQRQTIPVMSIKCCETMVTSCTRKRVDEDRNENLEIEREWQSNKTQMTFVGAEDKTNTSLRLCSKWK